MKDRMQIGTKVRVWDLGLRLFHWFLVLGILNQFLTMEFGEGSYTEWHFRVGFCILGLLIYRIIWGFIGSESVQFSTFLYSPSNITSYLKSLPSTTYHQYLGHNPVGGLSAILLLLVCAAMAVSGLFISDDILWEAPFYNAVSNDISDLMYTIHHWGEKALIGIVAMHVAAIVFYRWRKKAKLTTSMVTGNMQLQSEQEALPKMRSNWLSVLLLVICVSSSFLFLSQRM